MSGSRLGRQGVGHLAVALHGNDVLTELRLDGVAAGDAGADRLAFALHLNAVVASLSVEFNNVRASGARAFAEMLGNNHVLKKLSLVGNPIGVMGLERLAVAVETNETIIDFAADDIDPLGLGHRINQSLTKNRNPVHVLQLFGSWDRPQIECRRLSGEVVLVVDCKHDMTLSALESEITARLWCELALDSHRLKLILEDGTSRHQPREANLLEAFC